MEKRNFIENYEAPQLEVIEVAIEKGFAVTGDTEGFGDYQY